MTGLPLLPAAGAGEDIQSGAPALVLCLMGFSPFLQAPVAVIGREDFDILDDAINQKTAGVLNDINFSCLVLNICEEGFIGVFFRVALDFPIVLLGDLREHVVPIQVEVHSPAGNLVVVGVFVVNHHHALGGIRRLRVPIIVPWIAVPSQVDLLGLVAFFGFPRVEEIGLRRLLGVIWHGDSSKKEFQRKYISR